jgi:hypothetical protein
MRRLTLSLAVTLAALVATAQAAHAQNNKNQTGPTEQPGPFGFPGHKTLCERLKATPEQDAAILHIYNDYKKKEQKLNQALAQAAQKKDNSAPPPMPDAGTLKGNMIMEIRMILNDDQKKTFQEIVDDLGKKKKKANN